MVSVSADGLVLICFHPWQDCFLTLSVQDVIELGIPYSDPVADGPTIQQANIVAMNNGITTAGALDIVRTARRRGLQTPVLLMGYFNPILQYGEEKMVKDAREAGASGFIVVDLPYDEAGGYKRICRNNG